ncbi:zinc finger protein 62-like [Topomyia yanbarensis]|uniref:zinc finger protein 62-like n=1 Tax=Topomyia yanbarensis TaxID=2498891 RepID=UPI00273C8403|nr:zinc finger protein 62-like [Topomyia yanbarensis]
MMEPCCRLCGYNSADLVNVYTDQGETTEYVKKINRYLYLLVTPDDDLPKAICWMCSQQLDSFHKFHEKINEIQQRLLKDRYLEYVIELDQKYTGNEIEIEEHSVEEVQKESEEARQHEADTAEEYSTIQLIPSHDDSFLVVKTESISSMITNNQTSQENTQEKSKQSASVVEVFEIRRSTRKRSSIVRTNADNEESSESEESEDEIQLKQKTHLRKYAAVCRNAPEQPKFLLNRTSNISVVSTRTSPRNAAKNNKQQQPEEGSQRALVRPVRDCGAIEEDGSDIELPARDSDNEEWPAAETMEKFPSTIIKDGLLTVKGKELMQMINSFYNLQCDLCKDSSTRFKTLPGLFTHHKTIHKHDGYVVCCQMKMWRYPAVIMHMARHIQPEAFKCDICGYMVTRPRFLAAHRQTHLPEDQKPYACEHCPKRFCWKRALQVHLNLHKAPGERAIYMCTTCDKTYDTPGGLSAHKKNVHAKTKTPKAPHVCEICANKFATHSGLKEHMVTIHQPREKGQLQCPECFKWLMNSRCLRVHMQLHSKDDIACDQCNYKTKKESLLRRHKITHHQEERPFNCDKCSSTFKHKRALTVHVGLKHGQEKTSYKCNFCDRTFASSTNFYTHRKNKHPEELAAMKEQHEQERKLQRIKAGIEPDDIPSAQESTISTASDGTHIITIKSRRNGLQNQVDTVTVLDVVEFSENEENMFDA